MAVTPRYFVAVPFFKQQGMKKEGGSVVAEEKVHCTHHTH